MRSFRWGLLMVATATVFLSACANDAQDQQVASLSGSQPSNTTPSAAPAADQEAFIRCMEQNGASTGIVEIPKNGGEQGGEIKSTPGEAADKEKQQKALEQCRQYLPDGGTPKPASADDIEKSRSIAKCMRAAGVDFPDPDPNAAAGGPGALAIPPGVDMNDPAIREKFETCVQSVNAAAPAASTPAR